jgi:hypothetical protein
VRNIPFRTFIDWAFDGSPDTPIPKPEVDSAGNVITPDILKPSGPLNQRYVISMFMKNPKMCLYLNKHFNNINLWYVDKETLFKFLKRAILDFKMRRGDLLFMKSKRSKDKLVEKLIEKFPLLKTDDIRLLADVVENSSQKSAIYHSFGLKKPSKRKVKKEKGNKKTGAKTSAKNFLKKNFEIIKS